MDVFESKLDRETNQGLSHGWLLVGAFCLTYPVSTIESLGSSARWLIYILPGISFLWGMTLSTLGKYNRVQFKSSFLAASLLYAAIYYLSSYSLLFVDKNSVRDFLIIQGIFLTFFFSFATNDKMIETLFLVNAVIVIYAFITVGNVVSLDAIISSSGIAENSVAYPLAAIGIYFVVRKKWIFFILCTLLVLLASKRSAILASSVAIVYYMISIKYSILLKPFDKWLGVIACVVGAALALNFVVFIEFVQYIIGSDISSDALTMGRHSFFQNISLFIDSRGLFSDIFGSGAATADRLTAMVTLSITNPHNDWLKILVDYGSIGLIIMIVIINLIYGNSRVGVTFIIFTSILMITENTMIYYYHQFVTLFVFLHLRNKESADIKRHIPDQ